MSEEAPRRQSKVLDNQRLRTFLLGGAAGILAGILLAPRSGKELRGSIADRAGEARERSRETYFEAQERMRERLAASREGSRLRQEDTDLMTPGAAGPEDASMTAAQPRPHLRDVSRDVAGGEPSGEPGGEPSGESEEETSAERSEELRKKVRETRARLTERLDGSRGGEKEEDRDPGPEL